MQLFHKSVTTVETISENPSATSGKPVNNSWSDVRVFSTSVPTASPETEADAVTASTKNSKTVEIKDPISSTIISKKYSKHTLIASANFSNATWRASPGTLKAWSNTTRTYAVAMKIDRVTKFDNVVTKEKTNFKSKANIFWYVLWEQLWNGFERIKWRRRRYEADFNGSFQLVKKIRGDVKGWW